MSQRKKTSRSGERQAQRPKGCRKDAEEADKIIRGDAGIFPCETMHSVHETNERKRKR